MALQDDLRSDLTDAIRGRDELRSATLRMALAALQVEAVSGAQSRELSDADVLAVLGREESLARLQDRL